VAIAGLLAVAAFGLAGRSRVTLSLDPVSPTGPAQWSALVAADAAWVLAATVVIARTSVSGTLGPALRKALLVNAGMLLVLFLVVSGGMVSAPRAGAPPVVRRVLDGDDPWTTQLDVPGLRFVLAGVVPLAVLAAVVGAVLLVWTLVATRGRFHRRGATGARPGRPGRGPRRAASPAGVLDAIVQARRALATAEQDRLAVIEAYAAMERAVEAHGAVRRAAQTPAEFLRSALDADLLRDEAAALRLLRLFELARFSHEELPTGAAAALDRDLGVLQAELEATEVTTR